MSLSKEICFRLIVRAQEESFVQSLVEGHDGMATILSTKSQNREVEMVISSSESFRSTLLRVLVDLQKTVGIKFQEEICL